MRVQTITVPAGIKFDELLFNPSSVIESCVVDKTVPFKSLTLAHGMSPFQKLAFNFDGVPPPKCLRTKSLNLTHFHFSGIANGTCSGTAPIC